MKLVIEAQAVLNSKIEEALNEIDHFFDEDIQDSYLIVLFNYFQIENFMQKYIIDNPSFLIKEDEDEIADKYGFKNDLTSLILDNIPKKYINILSIFTTTFIYSRGSYDYFMNMSITQLEEEKLSILQKL